jgi:hypothetical protein
MCREIHEKHCLRRKANGVPVARFCARCTICRRQVCQARTGGRPCLCDFAHLATQKTHGSQRRDPLRGMLALRAIAGDGSASQPRR